MSLISLSTNQIAFESNDAFKTVQMTNVGTSELNRKPIMYKIKTNKIDYVDAKPSCGYISGLKGQNEINVIIRSLTSKKEFSAKLQILYVSDDRITEELVEKNKKHFDLIEYNELYDSIKQGNQSDVKTAIINVTRKGADAAEEAPIDPHSDLKNKMKIAELTQSIKDKTLNKLDTAQTKESKSSLKSSLVLLMIGILVGFLLGAKYGTKLSLFDGSHSSETFRSVNQINEEELPKEVEKEEPKYEGESEVEIEKDESQEETNSPEQVLSSDNQESNNEASNFEENQNPQESNEEGDEINEGNDQENFEEFKSELMEDEEPQEETIVVNVDEDTL